MNFNSNAELKLHCKSPENRLTPHRHAARVWRRLAFHTPQAPCGVSQTISSGWKCHKSTFFLSRVIVSTGPTSPNYQLASVVQKNLSRSLVPLVSSHLKPTPGMERDDVLAGPAEMQGPCAAAACEETPEPAGDPWAWKSCFQISYPLMSDRVWSVHWSILGDTWQEKGGERERKREKLSCKPRKRDAGNTQEKFW